MTTAHLSKLHATGNDFLVWSWLGPEGSGLVNEASITGEQAARSATGTGASGPTASSW